MSNEFYIGWMPKTPPSFARQVKKFIGALVILVVVAAILLSRAQKKFGSGNFEFGKLTEISGVYFSKPVPCVKVMSSKDVFGNRSYITIPLLGFGKMGAAGIISDIEKEKNTSLNQKEITLRGTLLYNDGKLLMQVDSNDKPLLAIGKQADSSLLPNIENLGELQVKGEIVDPKCYFGVMKPGEGKPHKDCAIRCILGGVSPVLRVMDKAGAANYYLLAGADGENMNEAVKDFIAEPVTVHARAVKHDDWIILYVDHNKGIQSYSYLREKFGDAVQYCATDCVK